MKIFRKLQLAAILTLALTVGASGVMAAPAQMDAVKKTTRTVVTKTKRGATVTTSKSKTIYAKGKRGTKAGYRKTRRGVGKAYRVTKGAVVGAKKQM
jgi:hypothetical protein